MGLELNRFNRIIDLVLYTTDGGMKTIRCPRHGRKPSIEINGTYTSRSFLESFNLTVKNFYMDLQTEQYARIKVVAGYENKTIEFEGTILTIYQEEPGPDGKTVIQCKWGKLQDWLDASGNFQFDAGASITDVLEAIKNQLKATQIKTGDNAKALTLKEPFLFNGTARGAMDHLAEMFQDKGLVVILRDTTLYANCIGDNDTVAPKIMQYMSAPPQPNTGGSDGTYYTTVTGPWMPDLNLFDKLTIPSRVYIRNFGLVGTGKTQNIQVTQLSFHFGTTGSTNSMTVQGTIAR